MGRLGLGAVAGSQYAHVEEQGIHGAYCGEASHPTVFQPLAQQLLPIPQLSQTDRGVQNHKSVHLQHGEIPGLHTRDLKVRCQVKISLSHASSPRFHVC